MIYEREIKEIGGSSMLIIPTDLAKYLELTPGEVVCLKDDIGKYGKFLSMWNKKQDKKK
jgi:antitoxin component of MazEF toxin-antitoxin module